MEHSGDSLPHTILLIVLFVLASVLVVRAFVVIGNEASISGRCKHLIKASNAWMILVVA
jgi:hypothetical protein